MFCKDDRWESGVVDLPAVETAGFKMIDVSSASILSVKFRTAKILLEYIICSIKRNFIAKY